jgi:hypothetical protein
MSIIINQSSFQIANKKSDKKIILSQDWIDRSPPWESKFDWPWMIYVVEKSKIYWITVETFPYQQMIDVQADERGKPRTAVALTNFKPRINLN